MARSHFVFRLRHSEHARSARTLRSFRIAGITSRGKCLRAMQDAEAERCRPMRGRPSAHLRSQITASTRLTEHNAAGFTLCGAFVVLSAYRKRVSVVHHRYYERAQRRVLCSTHSNGKAPRWKVCSDAWSPMCDVTTQQRHPPECIKFELQWMYTPAGS
jgi:hypothetical protein